MPDIVERLRKAAHGPQSLYREAADDIQRLRAEVQQISVLVMFNKREAEKWHSETARKDAVLRELVVLNNRNGRVISAIVEWLEDHRPDVFKSGLWTVIDAAKTRAALAQPDTLPSEVEP